ncbi:class I SAM-dependent methyltransferase [Nonomuraea sp. NPDC050663]|uniref:class I SAM-dependent methyltransferase n=1 Tax=Nonomuraea sp. NPDC050663 TaxID=3364370 RepID=UPI003796B070
MAVPRRLEWAVELLDVRPDDRILEIGPGGGVAAELICGRLDGGSYTGIDRSATQIERARRRVPGARWEAAAIEDYRCDERFTKVLAVNVNLFWTRSPAHELELIAGLLEPGGELLLVYDSPGGAGSVAEQVARAAGEHGFEARVVAGDGLAAVRARPRGAGRPGP